MRSQERGEGPDPRPRARQNGRCQNIGHQKTGVFNFKRIFVLDFFFGFFVGIFFVGKEGKMGGVEEINLSRDLSEILESTRLDWNNLVILGLYHQMSHSLYYSTVSLGISRI